jgi:hypothetical protein
MPYAREAALGAERMDVRMARMAYLSQSACVRVFRIGERQPEIVENMPYAPYALPAKPLWEQIQERMAF